MAQQIQLRRDTAANWSTVNPVLAIGEIGLETDTDQFKIGNGVDTWGVLGYGGIQGPANTNIIQDFGTGEDGDVVISAGITTLSQDMFYNNLTINGTGQLRTNGFRVFVRGTLDISAAAQDAITLNGNDGAAATTQTGASGGAAYAAATLGLATAGGTGATGVAGVGASAAATTGTSPSNGGASGAGGAGGNGGSGAGGALRAAAGVTLPLDIARFTYDLIRGVTLIQGGAGGPGGGSGAGDGVNLGRGGGGGGCGGGILYLAANTVVKSGSTPARCISVRGGRGGNGATATVGNVGGGGGAAGGGGGYIYLAYSSLSGAVVSDLLDASGGDGGNGGNGFGTGIGGNGGSGGNGGRIRLHRTVDGVGSTLVGNVGGTGSAGVGVTGGAGAAGGTCKRGL